MNGTIKVFGGNRLKGEVTPIPNKNSIVSSLPSALLTDEKMVYENVPDSSDVAKILEILRLLGAKIERDGAKVAIQCDEVSSYVIDPSLGGEFRASLMFAGPLLARFGKAQIPMPGGCLLGFRSIAAHVDVFRKVGIKVEERGDSVLFVRGKNDDSSRVWQYEASVTATENLAMYAAGIEEEVEIVDAAAEPHVSDILKLLVNMGAKIDGIGTNHLRIKGKKKLKGVSFVAGPDFVDIAGYMTAVGVAGGEIRIKGGNIWEVVGGLVNWFRSFGIQIKEEGDDLIVSRKQELKYNFDLGMPLASEGLPKLAPRPWPGFPVDVIPVMATLASKTKGRLLLQNWMYESGFDFIRELNALGADIFMADPQKIIINGPVRFRGGSVTPPPVIQATKAVFLASLADPVETTIYGVDVLKRRYPNIFEVYRGLGADITRVGEFGSKM